MTNDDVEEPTVGVLLGGLTALAFIAHVFFTVMIALPSEDSPRRPFGEVFVEVAIPLWGLVGSLIVALIIFGVVASVTDYLVDGGLRNDLRRWRSDD